MKMTIDRTTLKGLAKRFFRNQLNVFMYRTSTTLSLHQTGNVVIPVHKRRSEQTKDKINDDKYRNTFYGLSRLIHRSIGNTHQVRVADGNR